MYINAATPPSADWSTSIQPSAFGFSPIGLGLPDVHASTGPMDKWFLINQLLAFRARERHARQPPEQKIESTLTGRKLVRIPLWTFFLLRTRPPSPDDHPERVWVMPQATGGPWECGLLRRAADVVSCLGSSATKVGEEQQPGHANRHKRATYDDRRLQRQPKPPLWPAGTLGCKKRAKRQPQREVLTTRLCHQEL